MIFNDLSSIITPKTVSSDLDEYISL